MDDLSRLLDDSGTGCRVGNKTIDHLVYDDDLLIFCPHSADLQEQVCSQYGNDFDVKNNSRKSIIMIVWSRREADVS